MTGMRPLRSPGGGRFQMRDRPLVIMAVQDQFGAVARDDGLEFARVGQVAHRGCARKQRGMMNEDDARQSAPPRFVEQPGEPMELVLADVPRRHQRPRRHAGRQADQRDIVAHAQKRVAAGRLDPQIAGRPRREQRRQIGHRAMRIGVVIARREADVGGRPERVHPRGGRRKFGRQPDVHDIAGHRDVIGPLTAQIGDEAPQHAHIVEALAPALPVDVAQRPLGGEIAQAQRRHRTQVRVGEMGDRKAHEPRMKRPRSRAPKPEKGIRAQ